MTVKIQQYDRTIKRLTETEYPETQALLQVYGVGQLTALTYVLTLGSKERFKRNRDVGCYLGLRPRRSSPGIGTRNLASPRLATSTSDVCWSSAPTMYLVRVEETQPCVGGDWTWPREEASSPTIVPSSPSPASSRFCFIASGSRKSRTSRSMQKLPEDPNHAPCC